MEPPPPTLDYDSPPRPRRVWGLSRPVWVLVTVFLAVFGAAAWFATNGHLDRREDRTFAIAMAILVLAAGRNSLKGT